MSEHHDCEHMPTSAVRLSRRHFIRRIGLAGAGLAALPLLAACGTEPTPTTTGASGAGATMTSAPTAVAAATIVAGTPVPPPPIGSPGAAGAAGTTVVPPSPTAIAGIPRAKSSATVTGKYQLVQNQDFHPDHNAFLRAEIQKYCEVQGWDLGISYAAGFTGSGDLLTALISAVQSGNPPDAFFHDIGVRQYQSQGVLEPVTAFTKEMIGKYGATYPGYEDSTFFENEWWGVPFYGRAGGMYVRKDIFARKGLSVEEDTETYDKLRESALKLSDPDNRMWGWGMTVNRSGDGNSMVQQVLLRYGMTLQDETGQLITFSRPETIAGLKWLKETYTDPKWAKMLPPGVLSWTDPSNNEAFLAGTIGITDNAGTMYAKAVFDKVAFADQIQFVARPVRVSDKKRLDSLAGARLHLIKGSKNRDASLDLFRHLLTQPVQDQLLTISPGYVLPPYRNAWDSPLLAQYPNAINAKPLAFPTDRFTGLRHPGPSSAAVDAIGGGNYFTDMVAEVIQGKPAEEVVKDYHDRFIQIFKDFGLKGR